MASKYATEGKSPKEIRAMRDGLRFSKAVDLGMTNGEKYMVITSLTVALEAALRATPPPSPGPVFRTCCAAAIVGHEVPYAYKTDCPCHGRTYYGTAD